MRWIPRFVEGDRVATGNALKAEKWSVAAFERHETFPSPECAKLAQLDLLQDGAGGQERKRGVRIGDVKRLCRNAHECAVALRRR